LVLGKRVGEGDFALTRETFLCKVKFENGTPIFNAGYGKVLMEQPRPDLPWTPVSPDPERDEFEDSTLALKWHFIRVPKNKWYSLSGGQLKLKLQPEIADSLVNPAMIVQKLTGGEFEAATKLTFKTEKSNEQAGLVIYRNSDSYYMLLKSNSALMLIRKTGGKKEVIATAAYTALEVYLKAIAGHGKLKFSFGASANQMTMIGEGQDLKVIAESAVNRFNGPGVGVYVSSNGKTSSSSATFDWFSYKLMN